MMFRYKFEQTVLGQETYKSSNYGLSAAMSSELFFLKCISISSSVFPLKNRYEF